MAGNPVWHFEIMATEPERAKAFYGKVFDWEFETWPGPMEYVNIKTGKAPEGGLMKKPEQAPMPALNVYFLVDSVDETLAKAEGAGGRVVVPKMEIPTIGFHACFLDPDGICICLFEELKK